MAALLLAAAGSVAVAGTEKAEDNTKPFLLNPAMLTLTVAADGTPKDPTCGPKVEATICPIVLRAVPKLKFTPGKRDGVATAMDINLTLGLVAVPKPGGFGVQATQAWVVTRTEMTDANISFQSRRLNPPIYPRNSLMRGKTGVVIVELWPQPDSEFLRVGKIWFQGKPTNLHNEFVTATLNAVAKWTINRGAPEQLSFCVPVEFTLGGPVTVPQPATPCEATYVEGYAPPKLLTDVAQVAL